MNVSEFLSPLIAFNSDGYRQVRPNQGEGQRNLISVRVRKLLSHALGVKKFRYTPYRNMPKDVITDGGSEGQKKQERIHPEVRYIGVQMGVQFGRTPEVLQEPICGGRQWATPELGQMVQCGEMAEGCSNINVQNRIAEIGADQYHGHTYNPSFDLNAMALDD